MVRMQSNRLKCRNLPDDYLPIDQMTNKPTEILVISAISGLVLLMDEDLLFMGSIVLFMSIYSLIFSRSVILIEFCKDFVIFYLDEKREECYVIYWNEIIHYEYKSNHFNSDVIKIVLLDGTKLEFKCLSRRQVLKYFKNYVHLLEHDD